MRRSEALKLITNIISEVTYENLAEKRAEKILNALEEVGMNPPSYFNESLTHTELVPFVSVQHKKISLINEWEPENENLSD